MGKILLVLLLSLTTVSPLHAQTPFYQGKTAQIRVAFAAGGAFDAWRRLIANYWGKYVPGSPTLVVQMR
jgi:tripartite-type tricarboxylate transporter receptor subunit TctC